MPLAMPDLELYASPAPSHFPLPAPSLGRLAAASCSIWRLMMPESAADVRTVLRLPPSRFPLGHAPPPPPPPPPPPLFLTVRTHQRQRPRSLSAICCIRDDDAGPVPVSSILECHFLYILEEAVRRRCDLFSSELCQEGPLSPPRRLQL